MGKKAKLRLRLAVRTRDLADAEAELEAVKWELATAINRIIEIDVDNDALQAEVDTLRGVVVGQATVLFADDKPPVTSTPLYDSAEWPQ